MCKKRTKRCIARSIGLAMGLAMAMGLMFSMKAMAVSDKGSVTFEGSVKVNASSTVTDTAGFGFTTSENYNPAVNAKVKGTYTYVHPLTGESGSKVSDWMTGPSSASISYNAPTGYRSLSMQCEHMATYQKHEWTYVTAISYYQ